MDRQILDLQPLPGRRAHLDEIGPGAAGTDRSRTQSLRFLTYDKLAVEHDLVDLVSVMCATGVRLGEACAVTWDAVDLTAGTVRAVERSCG